MTQVTEEMAENMKKVLFDTFLSQYQQITRFINQLPITPQLKAIIIKHFDDGFLWTKESFTTIQFAAPAPQAAGEPDLHIVEDSAAVA